MVTHVPVDLLGDLALVEGSDAIAGDDLEDAGELGLGKALARLEDLSSVAEEIAGAGSPALQQVVAGALLQGVLQLGDGIPLAGDADGGREDRAPGQPAVVLVRPGVGGQRTGDGGGAMPHELVTGGHAVEVAEGGDAA